MKLSWPKYVALWMAVAAYSVQAVIGGPGVAICLGQTSHDVSTKADHSVSAEWGQDACSHDSDCDDPKLVAEHDSEETCPCTDISIRNEPGRVEQDYAASFKCAAPVAMLAPIVVAIERCLAPFPPLSAQPTYGQPPTVVRTVVLLI